jgi:hypothetical protein
MLRRLWNALIAHATVVVTVLGLLVAGTQRPDEVTGLVAGIVHADYAADRAALQRLFDALVVPPAPNADAVRVHYWRGFARWRRAINGVNDGAPAAEMLEDLRRAAAEFEASLAIDPAFVDSTAGLVSSIGIQLFLTPADAPDRKVLIDRVVPLVTALRALPPGHPRVAWVLGQAEWSLARARPDQPPLLDQQERIIAGYVRALEGMRARRATPLHSLDPRWGEPELLMNLAWSQLNKASPDPVAAERYAREALALVPHWHYVRDILLPQIERARR